MNDNSKANLGWLFYKDYYSTLRNPVSRTIMEKGKGISIVVNNCLAPKNIKEKKVVELLFREKNCNLITCAAEQGKTLRSNYQCGLPEKMLCGFELTTIYPGLVSGIGISHETGLLGECKLGFQFDYTTGLPYIPGSSVKGLLRSVFPFSLGDSCTDNAFRERYSSVRTEFIIDECRKIDRSENGEEKEYSSEDIELLKKSIFENGDIFFDAFVSSCGEKGMLGLDFITPHKNPLKDPNPIQFLKILSDVKFKFLFKLNTSVLTGGKIFCASKKLKLFENILRNIGIGAKTNVGYGQFE